MNTSLNERVIVVWWHSATHLHLAPIHGDAIQLAPSIVCIRRPAGKAARIIEKLRTPGGNLNTNSWRRPYLE